MKIIKNEKGFTAIETVIVILVLIIIGVAGYFVAKHKNNTSSTKSTSSTSTTSKSTNVSLSSTPAYEVAVQKFIIAIQNNNKTAADGLQTAAFSKTIEQGVGSNDGSFYDSCKSTGAYCTGVFAKGYLSGASLSTKSYTAADGTKGYEVDYTVKSSSSAANSNGSDSGNSNNVVSFDTVEVGGQWQIDNFNESSNSSVNVNAN